MYNIRCTLQTCIIIIVRYYTVTIYKLSENNLLLNVNLTLLFISTFCVIFIVKSIKRLLLPLISFKFGLFTLFRKQQLYVFLSENNPAENNNHMFINNLVNKTYCGLKLVRSQQNQSDIKSRCEKLIIKKYKRLIKQFLHTWTVLNFLSVFLTDFNNENLSISITYSKRLQNQTKTKMETIYQFY